MFEDSLLESSTKMAPVLRGKHWLISIIIGAATFFAMYFVLPMVSANDPSVIATQSAIVGVLVAGFALILCYVLTDAKRFGFNRVLWFVVVLLLNLVGFIIYLIYSAAKTGDWKRATLPVAYIFEVIIIGVMVLVPLIYTEALPKAQLMTFLAAPPPPPPPPPPPAAAAPVKITRHISVEDVMRAPTVIPKTIAQVKDEPEPAPNAGVGVVGGVPGGMPGGSMGGVLGGVIGGVMSSAAPPPPPPPKPQAPKRIRVGGQVESARLIFQPRPEYPPLAKMARIQGVVRLDAIISKDGSIQDLKVISGHPLLVKSALEAVQRWRYQPTLLNGDAVEVATEIDVNFTLAE
ncbi:MAG TPA: energy transducer TonB [Terriglobia bacterium]|nr:energy transducer TonB [Terriglobia bacterium]